MKQKKYEEHLKTTLPESEEVECKKCERKFYDEFNLLSLAKIIHFLSNSTSNINYGNTSINKVTSSELFCFSVRPLRVKVNLAPVLVPLS